MLFQSLFADAAAVLSLASIVCAAPVGPALEKRADIDTTILQFALTLEHLENVFYKDAIKNFSLADFQAAGYSQDYYNNLNYIAEDEQDHVVLLEGALKAANITPVAACTYDFKYTDVNSFVTTSSVLEGVGTSAYLGGAPLITNKAYLTVAGSILAVEALHTSMQRLAKGEVPMANPLYTPLDPTSVYTLAAMFIVSCPSSNPPLGFAPFPALALKGDTCTCEEPECGAPSDYIRKRGDNLSCECSPPSTNDNITLTGASNIPAGSYVTFVSGLTVTSVEGSIFGDEITVSIPPGVSGQSYVFVTKCDIETTFDDTEVLFGPAIVEVNPAKPSLDYSILKI